MKKIILLTCVVLTPLLYIGINSNRAYAREKGEESKDVLFHLDTSKFEKVKDTISASQTKTVDYDADEHTKEINYSRLEPGVSVKPGEITFVKGTNVGTYLHKVKMDGGSDYVDFELELTLVIRAVDLPGNLVFPSSIVTYDSKAHKIETITKPANTTVFYKLKGEEAETSTAQSYTEAGVYEITARVHRNSNYNDKETTSKLTINKADLNLPKEIRREFALDGTEHTLILEEKLPKGVTVTYVNNIHSSLGEHKGKAIINGGNNYNNTEIELVIVVMDKKIIDADDVDFPIMSVPYNENLQTIEVKSLPVGATVTYTQNSYKDVGAYPVTATVKLTGYEDLEVYSTLFITKADLAVTSIEKEVTYNEKSQSVELVSALPAGVTVTYKNNVHTEAGTHKGEAIINGGVNYNNKTVALTLVINKADIKGITLPNQTVAYDTKSHSLTVAGVKAGDVVTYDKNDYTEVGAYDVTATVDRGTNYTPVIAKGTLTITKADLAVTSIEKEVAYNEQSQSVELVSALPAGVTVTYKNNVHTEAGTHKGEAIINGGVNYNNKTVALTLVINKADIKGITFFNTAVDYNGKEQVIEIEGKLPVGTSVVYEKAKQVQVGIYNVIAKIVGGKNYNDLTLNAIFEIKAIVGIIYVDAKQIVLQKFQNTLAVNNNSATNGGFKFTSYQWYKNGVLVSTNQSYSVGQSERDKLNPNDNYYLVAKTIDGKTVQTSRVEIYEQGNREVKLYPNPVSSSDLTTNVMVDYSADQFSNGRVDILTVEGRFVYRQELSIGENRIVFPNQMSQGVYLAVIDINGRKQTIRFIVK